MRGQGSESSRKDSTEADYFSESQPYYHEEYQRQDYYSFKDQKGAYYSKKDDFQGRQGPYLNLSKGAKSSYPRDAKSSCYSSGTSSAGSHKKSYQGYNPQDYGYSHSYNHKSNHIPKIKKNYYGEGYGGNAEKGT